MRHNRNLVTLRGIGLFLAGTTLSCCGWFMSEPALLWPGIFLIALPLLSAVSMLFAHPGLRAQRTVLPHESSVGQTAEMRLTITERLPPWLGETRIDDVLPAGLGEGRSLLLPLRGAGRSTEAAYPLVLSHRGRYEVDGARSYFTDPLGLAHRSKRLAAPASVVVFPHVLPLTVREPSGAGRIGQVPLPSQAVRGPDDVVVREYRPKDDVRRIHWPSSARTGTLMVRREHHAWDPTAWLLIDDRPGHPEQFEWLVTLVATLGAALLDHGFDVHVRDGHRPPLLPHTHHNARRTLLYYLVDATSSPSSDLEAATRHVPTTHAGLLVLVLVNHLTADDVPWLLGLTHRDRRCVLIYLTATDEPTLVDRLRTARWDVFSSTPGVSPTHIWAALERPSR